METIFFFWVLRVDLIVKTAHIAQQPVCKNHVKKQLTLFGVLCLASEGGAGKATSGGPCAGGGAVAAGGICGRRGCREKKSLQLISGCFEPLYFWF